MRREKLGARHVDVLMVIGKFGQQLHAQGELHAARQLFEETLNGRIETLGKRHVDTLKSRNNLAAVLYAAGDLKAARLQFDESLTVHRDALGREHQRPSLIHI